MYGLCNESKDIETVECLYVVNLARQCAELQDAVIKMQQSLQELENSKRIKETMDINRFIAPLEEVIDNVDKDLVDQIVDRYGADREAETTEENFFKKSVK